LTAAAVVRYRRLCMSSDCDVRSDIEKMCAALLQLLPLQDEREALSIQGITYMSDCVLRCAVAVAGHWHAPVV
jgi:predicted metal-binding protein